MKKKSNKKKNIRFVAPQKTYSIIRARFAINAFLLDIPSLYFA